MMNISALKRFFNALIILAINFTVTQQQVCLGRSPDRPQMNNMLMNPYGIWPLTMIHFVLLLVL